MYVDGIVRRWLCEHEATTQHERGLRVQALFKMVDQTG